MLGLLAVARDVTTENHQEAWRRQGVQRERDGHLRSADRGRPRAHCHVVSTRHHSMLPLTERSGYHHLRAPTVNFNRIFLVLLGLRLTTIMFDGQKL